MLSLKNMTKWPIQKQTHRTEQKHAEHQDATDIENKLFLCFSDFYFFILYSYMISPKKMSYCLGTVKVCWRNIQKWKSHRHMLSFRYWRTDGQSNPYVLLFLWGQLQTQLPWVSASEKVM